jgi:hypothetical protein
VTETRSQHIFPNSLLGVRQEGLPDVKEALTPEMKVENLSLWGTV